MHIIAGAKNFHTDIKEASFYGADGEFVIAGSDDGFMYVWNCRSGCIESVLRGEKCNIFISQPS